MKKKLSKRQLEIIETSIRLIGEGGIQALTIKNLAAAIGVAESALYRHFKSKIDVLTALLDFLSTIIINHYNSVGSLKADSFEKIKKMIEGQLRIFSENPPYAIVILSDGLFKNEKILQDKILNIMHNAKSTYTKIIEEGQKTGAIRNDIPSDQLAFVIMGSVRLTVNQWSIAGFSFDLPKKGDILYNAIKTLIKNPNK